MQTKAVNSLLANSYSIWIIVVCGLNKFLNQFQRMQKWHSVDLKLEYQKHLEINVSNHSKNCNKFTLNKMWLIVSSCSL